MKSILSLIALCTVVSLSACSSSNKSTSMGAVGDKNADCCAGKSSDACCKDKAATSADTNMGAVGEKKAGCCSGDAKTCPVTGKSTTEGTNMGAMGDAKPGCCGGGAAKSCPESAKTGG